MPRARKLNATKRLYTTVISPLFPEAGLLVARRISDGGQEVCDCLFEQECPRTILSDFLLICASLTRTATKKEQKVLRRIALHKSLSDKPKTEPFSHPVPETVCDVDEADLELTEAV